MPYNASHKHHRKAMAIHREAGHGTMPRWPFEESKSCKTWQVSPMCGIRNEQSLVDGISWLHIIISWLLNYVCSYSWLIPHVWLTRGWLLMVHYSWNMNKTSCWRSWLLLIWLWLTTHEFDGFWRDQVDLKEDHTTSSFISSSPFGLRDPVVADDMRLFHRAGERSLAIGHAGPETGEKPGDSSMPTINALITLWFSWIYQPIINACDSI